MDVGDTVTLAATTKPSWLNFDPSTGVLSGTPTNSNVGDHSVVLTATDGSGAVDTQSFTIAVANTNDAPTITSSQVTSATEDAAYSYTFEASDVDSGDTPTLAATTLPSWLSFDTSTGVLSGTPVNSNVGDHSVVIIATDGSGAVDTQSFTITVANTNDAPTITSTQVTSATEDTAYSYTFEANDVDVGDAPTLAATTKPSWLSFDPSTGVLSGTPTNSHVGDHSVVLTATDGSGAVDTQSFTITVANTNDAPTISVSNGNLTEDSGTYTVSGTVVGSDVDTNTTLTYASNTLTGSYGALSLNTNTGAYTYTLDNSNSDVQGLNDSETLTESFTVSVSDGTATTPTTLSFTINGANDGPSGLTLSASSVAENSAGATIGTLSATDTDGDTLSYSLASGGDNNSFEISGTTLKLKDSVSANYEANNVYDLTITVTDGTTSQSISQEVTVTNVNEANTSYYNGKADTNASSTLNSQNDPAVEQLMSGYFWGNAGSGIDLTYSFIDSSSTFSNLYNYTGTTQWLNALDPTAAFESTVSEILDLFSNVSLLNFTEVDDTSSSVGHIRFGTAQTSQSAYAYLPYTEYPAVAGDIWLDDTANLYNNSYALMDGNYWHFTIMHEIGHALGLAHTQDSSSYGSRTYGSESSVGGIHNSNPYSIMAYAEYVDEPIDAIQGVYARPTTLMIDDIAAIQHIYGSNEQYNSGDTTYSLSTMNTGLYSSLYGIDFNYSSIWDAGGEDTFTWSEQSTIASINLNDGEFSCFGNISSVSDPDLNGWSNESYFLDGDGILGIGYDVLIENAIGGSNTDTIVGNEAANKLYGGSGSGVKDTLTGGAGADTFICSISDATTDINLADIITDFTAGTDKIGLEDKTVAELTWSDASSGTQIYETSTSKILFYLNSVSSDTIDEDDFVQTDFV